jgi:hypothetical protein
MAVTDSISGGYYIPKTIPRPRDLSDILPNRLLTMSTCFTRVVRDIIELQWDDYDNVRESITEQASEFGIPQAQIPELVTWAKAQRNTNESQLEKDVNRGSGLLELVSDKRPAAEGGAVLGLEPLGFEALTFHLWLRHYAPDGVFKRFGIRPNQIGLIANEPRRLACSPIPTTCAEGSRIKRCRNSSAGSTSE